MDLSIFGLISLSRKDSFEPSVEYRAESFTYSLYLIACSIKIFSDEENYFASAVILSTEK